MQSWVPLQNAAGSFSKPRKIMLGRHRSESVATLRCRSGIRRRRVLMAIWASRRASGAPTQKCIPCPNDKCLFGSRVISSASGFSKTFSSLISRPDHSERHSAARNGYSLNVPILPRIALGRHEHWRAVAKEFLDCCFDHRWISAQLFHLVRVLQERQHSSANQVDSRFMSVSKTDRLSLGFFHVTKCGELVPRVGFLDSTSQRLSQGKKN